MGHKVTVAYFSTKQGVTQQQTGGSAVYYGRVFKISEELFSEDGEVDFQKEITGLNDELRSKGMEPVLDQTTVERYETRDVDSGDVWVMYRVPCEPKGR